MFSKAKGYNQWMGGCSTMGDVFSTVEGIQHIGGISAVRWKDILSMTKGYLQYCGGFSAQWSDIISTAEEYHQYVEAYHE